jgi:hypothetical protein
MPVSTSALPGRPPQPSWRMRLMMSRISMPPCGVCVSNSMLSLPQRSQVMRMNHGTDRELLGAVAAQYRLGGVLSRGKPNPRTE